MSIIKSGNYKSSVCINNLCVSFYLSLLIFPCSIPTAIIFSPFIAIASAKGIVLINCENLSVYYYQISFLICEHMKLVISHDYILIMR